MNKIKRYLVFVIGLFINSLGVSLITKASLGTSPISSIPYVLSLKLPFTLGEFTIFFSVFLIILQLLILRKKFPLEYFLQIPISIAFGYFIDLTMMMLSFVQPDSYLYSLLALLIGCVILGFGVYTEVLANVAMLPGESFVRAVSQTWKTDFGTTKVAFDVSMTVIAGVLSFLFFGMLNGVREGTIIAAILVGFIARLFGRALKNLGAYLFGATPDEKAGEDSAEEEPCIVISRQYGSGGRMIGKKLAEKLGYQFYDNEIIQMTAGTTGYSPEFVKQQEENMTNSLLYDLFHQAYASAPHGDAPKDAIFEAEAAEMKKLAKAGHCVILGRCADYILRDHPNCLRVYLHAPLSARVQRVAQLEQKTLEWAREKVRREDQHRNAYYQYYTGRKKGQGDQYHLCINTQLGEAYVQQAVLQALKANMQQVNKDKTEKAS